MVVALPALAAVLAVLLAALLYYARAPLSSFLTAIIPDVNIPLIGNLRSIAVGTVQASVDWALNGLAAAWGYGERLILSWLHPVMSFVDAAVNFSNQTVVSLDRAIYGRVAGWINYAVNLANAIHRTLDVDIIALTARVLGWVSAAEAAAVRYAKAYADAIHAQLDYDIRAVDAALTADIGAVERVLAAQLVQDVHTLTADIGSVLAYAETGLGRAAAALDAGILEAERAAGQLALQAVTIAEGYASTAVTGAVRAIDTAVDDALAGILIDVGAAVTAVEGIIGTDLPDIGAALRAIPRDVVDLAGVATLVGTVALTLTRYLETCGIPNCRNLSYLGRVLQDVIGMVEAGAFVAFVIEAIDHPQETARVAYDIAAPVIRTTDAALRDMVTL